MLISGSDSRGVPLIPCRIQRRRRRRLGEFAASKSSLPQLSVTLAPADLLEHLHAPNISIGSAWMRALSFDRHVRVHGRPLLLMLRPLRAAGTATTPTATGTIGFAFAIERAHREGGLRVERGVREGSLIR